MTVYGATPKDEIKTGELFAGKKAVIFGVPGPPHTDTFYVVQRFPCTQMQDYLGGDTNGASNHAGAFTPGCSKTHLPGYVGDYDKLTAAGAQLIACVSCSMIPSKRFTEAVLFLLWEHQLACMHLQVTVNDAFVTAAWGEANHADGKVKMLADTHLAFTKVHAPASWLGGCARDWHMQSL